MFGPLDFGLVGRWKVEVLLKNLFLFCSHSYPYFLAVLVAGGVIVVAVPVSVL